MAILRVAGNANEFDTRSGLLANIFNMPTAPDFTSSMVFQAEATYLSLENFSQGEVWFSFYMSRGATNESSSGRYAVALYSGDQLLTGIQSPNNANAAVYRFDGSAVSSIASFAVNASTLYRIDVHWKSHPSTGRAAWYVNGTLAAEYNGNTGSLSANKLEFRRFKGTGDSSAAGKRTCYSAIMISDSDPRDIFLMERQPTADGFYDEWSGDYTDIIPSNNSPILTSIGADAPNKRSSFSYGAVSSLSDKDLLGVILTSVQSETDPDYGPTAPFFRTSSGGIVDTSPVSVGGEFKPVQRILADNNGVPWSYSDIATGEMGVRSY